MRLPFLRSLFLVAPLAIVALQPTNALAQPPAKNKIVGKWLGTIAFPDEKIRFGLDITAKKDGNLTGFAHSPDQDETPEPLAFIEIKDNNVKIEIEEDVSFEGKLEADGNTIKGDFIQEGKYPLTLKRVDKIPAFAKKKAKK